MKKNLFLAIMCLFIIHACSNENSPERAVKSGNNLIGTWLWVKATTTTPNGIVEQDDYGLTIGNLPKGKVTSRVVFKPDKTLENIVQVMLLRPSIQKGNWNLVKDSLTLNWGPGKIQVVTYRIDKDSLFFKFNGGKTTVKFVKATQ